MRHFYVVALDGVYLRGADGRLSFRRVIPHTVDIERLVLEIAERCEAWLERRGFGADEDVDPEEDDSLSLLQQASVGGYVAVGGARSGVRGGRCGCGRSGAAGRDPGRKAGRAAPANSVDHEGRGVGGQAGRAEQHELE